VTAAEYSLFFINSAADWSCSSPRGYKDARDTEMERSRKTMRIGILRESKEVPPGKLTENFYGNWAGNRQGMPIVYNRSESGNRQFAFYLRVPQTCLTKHPALSIHSGGS
jgi:hypothetical protein